MTNKINILNFTKEFDYENFYEKYLAELRAKMNLKVFILNIQFINTLVLLRVQRNILIHQLNN